jgi:hypothetical protein
VVFNYIWFNKEHGKESDHVPSATPHTYSLPLTVRPSAVITSSAEDMMAKGIVSMMDFISVGPGMSIDSGSEPTGGVYVGILQRERETWI